MCYSPSANRGNLGAMARPTTALPLVFLAIVTGGSLASGCTGCNKPADNTADAAPSTSATPASTSAAVVASDAAAPEGGATADEPGRRGNRRGPFSMLFQAARGLGLTGDTLKKVDDAEKLAAPSGDNAARDAAKELHAEVIAGIKANRIDPAKLEPKYAALERISLAEHDKEAASLNALYAALDATQRKAVVASARATLAKRDERMSHRDSDRGDAGGPDGGRANAGKRSLDRMMRGIELDAEQQKKIEALARKDDLKGRFDPAEANKRLEVLLEAFEKDSFDAKKVDTFDAKKHRAVLEEETKLVTQILPILKPEQREKLAARMERGPSPHGNKRPGFGHRSFMESEDDDFGP
jgi:Spy/CpxP family protein refolding chaperone